MFKPVPCVREILSYLLSHYLHFRSHPSNYISVPTILCFHTLSSLLALPPNTCSHPLTHISLLIFLHTSHSILHPLTLPFYLHASSIPSYIFLPRIFKNLICHSCISYRLQTILSSFPLLVLIESGTERERGIRAETSVHVHTRA